MFLPSASGISAIGESVSSLGDMGKSMYGNARDSVGGAMGDFVNRAQSTSSSIAQDGSSPSKL